MANGGFAGEAAVVDSPPSMLLQVEQVRKAFEDVQAVTDVSFSVGAGEIVGLLGPNGAGKSTTVGMVAGLLKPDAGRVLLDGRELAGDTDPQKQKLGLVPQDLAVYEELSAIENLRLFGALYGMSPKAVAAASARALEFVGLADRARDKAQDYSGGMKRRLNLAASMLHDPAVLLLDEPTVGVDPQSRNAIFDNLLELKRQGKALVYTTHYMEEAERLCDRIVIVDHGRVVATDTVRGLLGRLPAASRLRLEMSPSSDVTWVERLAKVDGVRGATLADSVLTVGLDDLPAQAPAVLAWLAGQGLSWTHVSSERGDLEAVFLTLTGRRLRD
jgi:ABC-2 type transport system ATP-binding protein